MENERRYNVPNTRTEEIISMYSPDVPGIITIKNIWTDGWMHCNMGKYSTMTHSWLSLKLMEQTPLSALKINSTNSEWCNPAVIINCYLSLLQQKMKTYCDK